MNTLSMRGLADLSWLNWLLKTDRCCSFLHNSSGDISVWLTIERIYKRKISLLLWYSSRAEDIIHYCIHFWMSCSPFLDSLGDAFCYKAKPVWGPIHLPKSFSKMAPCFSCILGRPHQTCSRHIIAAYVVCSIRRQCLQIAFPVNITEHARWPSTSMRRDHQRTSKAAGDGLFCKT